jgi:hypothetical protein
VPRIEAAPIPEGRPAGAEPALCAARTSWVRIEFEFGSQAHASFHVEDMAVLGELIDEGGGQVIVFEK